MLASNHSSAYDPGGPHLALLGDHDCLGCRVHNSQKRTELEKLEKQLKIADQKLSSEGRQLDTLAHKVERLDNMREVRVL